MHEGPRERAFCVVGGGRWTRVGDSGLPVGPGVIGSGLASRGTERGAHALGLASLGAWLLPGPSCRFARRIRVSGTRWRMRCAYPPYNGGRRGALIGAEADVRALAFASLDAPASPGLAGECAALIRPTTAGDASPSSKRHAAVRVGQISAAHLPRDALGIGTASGTRHTRNRHRSRRWTLSQAQATARRPQNLHRNRSSEHAAPGRRPAWRAQLRVRPPPRHGCPAARRVEVSSAPAGSPTGPPDVHCGGSRSAACRGPHPSGPSRRSADRRAPAHPRPPGVCGCARRPRGTRRCA